MGENIFALKSFFQPKLNTISVFSVWVFYVSKMVVPRTETRNYCLTFNFYNLTVDEIDILLAEDSSDDEVEMVAIEP